MAAVDGVHDLAVHPVAFDAESGRWYADIQIATGTHYRPFVTLTLARHQPDSLSGLTTSTFVTLEPVRLGVNRTVNVVDGIGTADVTVTGVQHDGIPDRSSAGGPPVLNSVRVTVQEADPDVLDADLRWATSGTNAGSTFLATQTTTAGITTWTTAMTLPAVTTAQRLLIEELEPVARSVSGTVTMDGNVVFVDTVELTG